jgi:YbbR domain-containing protein
MSKRRNKEIQDSTTDFFLKVVQRNKEEQEKKSSKETTTKESVNLTKSKTIEKVGQFYNYLNQILDKILSSHISMMIVSFVMAVVLFVSISGGDMLSSPTSGTTLEKVPLQVEGLDDDYDVFGLPKSVKVGLIGPSLDIYTTKLSNNYEAYVDLKGLGKGEHTVKLQSRNFPDTLTVMLVPDTLKVKIAPKISTKYDLTYRFINEDQMDQKYSVSVEQMAVESVTIRASQETLNNIASVEACIDVSEKTESFEQDAVIRAYDKNGKILDIDIAPTTVHVKCNVTSYNKDVIVKANFIGNLVSGYQITNYSLSQSTVKIYGLKKDIDDISIVYVDVNVNQLNQSKTFDNLSLKKETGINKFSVDKISVTLEVDKVISKTFDKIPIKVLNQSKQYKVSFAGKGKYAKVKITGSEDKISQLTRSNIQASIDVNKLSVGTKKVKVKVVADDDSLKVKLLSSPKITINIERK